MLLNEKGELFTDKREIVKLFRKHFEILLNRQGQDSTNEDMTYHTVEPDIGEPKQEEVTRIIGTLKNNKSPSENKIPAELLKKGGKDLINALYGIISEVWKRETMPEEWNTAIICPIFKKGDPMLVSNNRGISLLDTGYKVFTSLLLERISPYATEIVGKYQCGFRKGKSTIDHIHTIRQIAEKRYEYNEDLHLVFIDFKQAYDSINREELWKVLRYLGIPQKYINLIKMCNRKTNLKVKSGLRQGDALSPMLLNIALEWLMRTANETRKMEVGEIETILAYADEVVIMENSRNKVEQTTIKFLEAGKIMGLEVNQEKTKYMCISQNDRNDLSLRVDPYVFEKVEAFKYLGININSKNNVHEEIKERVASANRCYYSLLKLFKSKLLSRESKVTLYTSYLRTVLVYGCET